MYLLVGGCWISKSSGSLAFYFTMPFTSEKRQCIRSPLFGHDVWLTKKLAESTIF